uniref:Uncharacterized protein n=1 Tax=uncultured marine microorganism HF4000_APKG2J17 TaxID=455546 RepID=B3T6N6_9ZZZZ|nr:hypothetical protein ALOHA_HF4000APKG2J17ctg1g52 [uncultured marine microorganism HF4000_APKG2J17]
MDVPVKILTGRGENSYTADTKRELSQQTQGDRQNFSGVLPPGILMVRLCDPYRGLQRVCRG